MNKNDTFVDCSSSMEKSVVLHRILFVLMTHVGMTKLNVFIK